MPSHTKKSHVFGTKSMPMKKTQASKKSCLTSLMSIDKLHNLLGSIPPTASKLCGDTRSGVLPTQTKITSVSVTENATEQSNPPVSARALDIASIHAMYVHLTPKYVKHTPLEDTCEITPMASEPIIDNLVTAGDTSLHSSENAETPPSSPRNALATKIMLPESDTGDVVPKRIASSSLSRSHTALDFPSLAVLPPARLYGDGQEPTGSCVPFATDESISQAHARRTFLGKPLTNARTVQPVLPGVAIQRLGSSRMFDSLFPTDVAPPSLPTTANAVPTAALSTAYMTSKLDTVLEKDSQVGDEHENQLNGSITELRSLDGAALHNDYDYNPLYTPLQESSDGVISYFDREPLLPINDSFSDDEDEITAELLPTYQSLTAPLSPLASVLGEDERTNAVLETALTGETEVRVTDTDWQLTDEDFGDSTELSVSDVAEVTQKRAATLSDEVSDLTAPVLQSLAGIKSSFSPAHGSLAIKPINNPKLRNVSESTASTSYTTQTPNGHVWSRTVSDSSATSTMSTSSADSATSNSSRAFQMSNTFLGSTSFSDLLAHLPLSAFTNSICLISKPALACAFILCVAAEHRDRLLFSSELAASGLTFITEAHAEKAMEFKVQRRAKLGRLSLLELVQMVQWNEGQTEVKEMWEAWWKAAVKEQELGEGVWGFM